MKKTKKFFVGLFAVIGIVLIAMFLITVCACLINGISFQEQLAIFIPLLK